MISDHYHPHTSHDTYVIVTEYTFPIAYVQSLFFFLSLSYSSI